MSDDNDKTALLQGDPETLRNELARAKEQEACLIVIRGAKQGHRFFLTQPESILGRDPTVDISISDQSISRKHAKFSKQKGEVVLTDLGSSNGTTVNGKKLTPHQSVSLSKEDMIKVGNAILKFLPQGELEIIYYGNLGDAANLDSLTKIYNKGYLLEALDAEFKRAKALHTDFSIVFFDLDHFKNVNDRFGHAAGDYVLREFTALIRSKYIRPKDVFARYGGEEFVVLLSGMGSESALQMAEQIRAAIQAHPFIFEGKRLPVTASMGVAELTAEMESPQTLLKQADKALYASKEGGRNKVTLAS